MNLILFRNSQHHVNPSVLTSSFQALQTKSINQQSIKQTIDQQSINQMEFSSKNSQGKKKWKKLFSLSYKYLRNKNKRTLFNFVTNHSQGRNFFF